MTKVRFTDGGTGFLGRPPRLTEAQKAARKAQEETTNTTKQRRLDTRRKVVLGGTVIALARDGIIDLNTVRQIITHMPDRDKALFDDWAP